MLNTDDNDVDIDDIDIDVDIDDVDIDDVDTDDVDTDDVDTDEADKSDDPTSGTSGTGEDFGRSGSSSVELLIVVDPAIGTFSRAFLLPPNKSIISDELHEEGGNLEVRDLDIVAAEGWDCGLSRDLIRFGSVLISDRKDS